MRIISWNVNGIRATQNKIKNGEKTGRPTDNTILSLIEEQKPDVLAFQELKTQDPADLAFLKPHFKYILTNLSKTKKGYSGVGLLSNEKPQWVSHDFTMYSEEELGEPYTEYEFTNEGRLITARFKSALIVAAYVPNSQPELARIALRQKWEELIRRYLTKLKADNTVPVVYIGDLNVAPMAIDLHDDRNKTKTPGASPEERKECKELLAAGFTDSFRHLKPAEVKYSYFSNFANAREKGKGWRIDMALVSSEHKEKIVAADCLNEYWGSDHCPILLELSI